jgi:hypothetical protein
LECHSDGETKEQMHQTTETQRRKRETLEQAPEKKFL